MPPNAGHLPNVDLLLNQGAQKLLWPVGKSVTMRRRLRGVCLQLWSGIYPQKRHVYENRLWCMYA